MNAVVRGRSSAVNPLGWGLGACLLATGLMTVGTAWGADSVAAGGSFHNKETWGGSMPDTGSPLYIKGPGDVVFSAGKTEWKNNIMLHPAAGETATFRQTGGFLSTTADFNIGDSDTYNSDGWGYVYITGGTNKLARSGKSWTVGRRHLNAYAEVSGSGVLDCSVSPMYISPSWAGASKSAEFHLKTGGTFIGTVINNNTSAIGAKFVFDGGTFIPTDANPFSTLDRLYVGEGGVVIDTQTRDVVISYRLQANVDQPGGLVKLGPGGLTLSGANAYGGPTIVSNGTLTVAGPASMPNYDKPGYVTVCSGATLVLGAGWTDAQKAALRAVITVEAGGTFGDPKTFDTPTEDVTDGGSYSSPDGGAKTGAYGLTLTGANDFGGLFIVKEGSLAAAFGAGLGAQDSLRLSGGQYAGWDGLVDQTLGTGAGQISIVAGTSSGFSAFTGDTTVRIGGSAGNVLPFGDAMFTPGVFVLNDARAKGTLTVENQLDLNGREMSVAVQSTTQPAVLSGGICSTSGDGTLHTVGANGGTLCLGGTNAFGSVYLETGRLVMGPDSSNTVTTVRVEKGDLTFDGSTNKITTLYTGHEWYSEARLLVVTNDATVACGTLELNLGTARQSGGVVEAETLRLGPYNNGNSGAISYQYNLSGGTLRARLFYMGEKSWLQKNGTGELIQTGGTVEAGYWSTDFIVGESAGQTSRYYLRGGRFEMPAYANDGKQKAVLIAHSGTGFLEVSGTGVMSAPYVCLCGWVKNNKTAVGEIRLLTGGRIESCRLGVLETGCTGSTVLLDGGTLRLRPFGSLKPEAQAIRNLANLYIGVNGFTLEIDDDSSSAAQPFAAAPNQATPTYDRSAWRTAPAFVKKGTGTFTLTGTNTYRCATAVEAGTLALAQGASLPEDSVVRVADGATLDLGTSSATVKLLAGDGTVMGDVVVTDALAADAESLALGKGLTVLGGVSFGQNAVIDVRGVDAETFRRSRKLVTASTPFAAAPALFVNGSAADDGWKIRLRNGNRDLFLARPLGLMVILQ